MNHKILKIGEGIEIIKTSSFRYDVVFKRTLADYLGLLLGLFFLIYLNFAFGLFISIAILFIYFARKRLIINLNNKTIVLCFYIFDIRLFKWRNYGEIENIKFFINRLNNSGDGMNNNYELIILYKNEKEAKLCSFYSLKTKENLEKIIKLMDFKYKEDL